MSDIYHIDIQDSIGQCEDIFMSLVDRYYNSAGAGDASRLEAEKDDAKDKIRNLCRAVEHRIELLLYVKDMINDFDWSKYHRFEYHREESKKTSGEGVVCQVLQDGKILIKFKHKESMENFVFINLVTFFSGIVSIVDNIALILRYSFNLKIPPDRLTNIWRVQKELPESSLKKHLHDNIIADKIFTGVLAVRKDCEHRDHSQVFIWSDSIRSEGIGSRVSNIPLIRRDLVDIDETARREISNYCEMAYSKLYNFLKSFFSLVLTTSL